MTSLGRIQVAIDTGTDRALDQIELQLVPRIDAQTRAAQASVSLQDGHSTQLSSFTARAKGSNSHRNFEKSRCAWQREISAWELLTRDSTGTLQACHGSQHNVTATCCSHCITPIPLHSTQAWHDLRELRSPRSQVPASHMMATKRARTQRMQ